MRPRDAYIAGRRGKHGKLATWRYDYTRQIADASYDVVAVLQGVQHTEDWRETGAELLRVMKPGRTIMLAEITFSPDMVMKAGLDLHIEYWMDKLFSPHWLADRRVPVLQPGGAGHRLRRPCHVTVHVLLEGCRVLLGDENYFCRMIVSQPSTMAAVRRAEQAAGAARLAGGRC